MDSHFLAGRRAVKDIGGYVAGGVLEIVWLSLEVHGRYPGVQWKVARIVIGRLRVDDVQCDVTDGPHILKHINQDYIMSIKYI